MKVTVYLREKKKGSVVVEALNELEALNKVKRMICLGRCDDILETSGIIITGTEPHE